MHSLDLLAHKVPADIAHCKEIFTIKETKHKVKHDRISKRIAWLKHILEPPLGHSVGLWVSHA